MKITCISAYYLRLLEVSDDYVQVPEKPDLGVTIDEEVIAKHLVT